MGKILMTKQKAIIIDLDGTLIDDTSTKWMYYEKNPNWEQAKDTDRFRQPKKWCLDLVTNMRAAGTYVIFLTGRPDSYRQQTEDWLEKHDAKNPHILMRKDGDWREDVLIKHEIYKKYIEPHYNIIFAIDDKKSVIDMWRAAGLTALHCDAFYL